MNDHTPRTQDQIVERINSIKDEDFFGWQTNDLLAHLDYEHAKAYLKEEITEEEWSQLNPGSPEESIRNYMSFAWDKANNRRGISAGRSLEHMKAWVWLDGNDVLLEQIEDDYEYYGKAHLVLICDHYGIDWRAFDDNEWVNGESDTPITADEAMAFGN